MNTSTQAPPNNLLQRLKKKVDGWNFLTFYHFFPHLFIFTSFTCYRLHVSTFGCCFSLLMPFFWQIIILIFPSALLNHFYIFDRIVQHFGKYVRWINILMSVWWTKANKRLALAEHTDRKQGETASLAEARQCANCLFNPKNNSKRHFLLGGLRRNYFWDGAVKLS